MDGLDFSALSDDQLVELARACCVESMRRGMATQSAMEAMMLDEAERARIAKNATEQTVSAMRAQERRRVAQMASEMAKQAEEERIGHARRQEISEAAERAAEQALRKQNEDMKFLQHAAWLVGKDADSINIVYVNTKYGKRVLINAGSNRYSNEHLSDYNCGTNKVSTTQKLVKNKSELIKFSVQFAAIHPTDTALIGSEYPF